MSTPVEAEVNGDVYTPDEGEVFANSAAASIGHMLVSIEQSKSALAGEEGVTGPSIEFLDAMHAAGTDLMAKWRARAARFAGHMAARDEHISPDLAGTQRGKYLDPTGQHQ